MPPLSLMWDVWQAPQHTLGTIAHETVTLLDNIFQKRFAFRGGGPVSRSLSNGSKQSMSDGSTEPRLAASKADCHDCWTAVPAAMIESRGGACWEIERKNIPREMGHGNGNGHGIICCGHASARCQVRGGWTGLRGKTGPAIRKRVVSAEQPTTGCHGKGGPFLRHSAPCRVPLKGSTRCCGCRE